jgi:hypothetical protein
MSDMRHPCFVLFALCSLLAACGGGQGSLFYLEPHKLTEMTCDELNQKRAAAVKRVKRSEELRQKASRDAAGPLVNALVYAPEHGQATWEHTAYDAEAARRNCPPPTAD